jgi:hypothetical protein
LSAVLGNALFSNTLDSRGEKRATADKNVNRIGVWPPMPSIRTESIALRDSILQIDLGIKPLNDRD